MSKRMLLANGCRIDESELRILIDFIFESDKIENIKNDKNEIRQNILTQNTGGHIGAMLFIIQMLEERRFILSEELVKQIQSLIIIEQNTKKTARRVEAEYIGQYRDIGIEIGSRKIGFTGIEDKMKNLISKTNEILQMGQKSIERVLFDAADFHYELERIHPFIDGNGRTGRALVYGFLRGFNFKPLIFTSHDKWDLYYPCFESEGNTKMREYFWKKWGENGTKEN